MACETQKTNLLALWQDAANQVRDRYNVIYNELVLLIAMKNKFCDPNDPSYNPVCCSVFGDRVTKFPNDLQNRMEQAIQFAFDAINAIDCNDPNVINQIKEALDRLKDIYDTITEINTYDVLFTSFLTDVSCADTNHHVPGDR